MDIKFHYICEAVLPAVLRIYYSKLAFIKVLSHTSFFVVQALLSLLAQSFPAAFFVAVFHARLEALALAVHLLTFTPVLLTLSRSLAWSLLDRLNWNICFHVVHVLARSLRLWLLLSGCEPEIKLNFFF